jgi:calcineurin-like phosphoesterase family protein
MISERARRKQLDSIAQSLQEAENLIVGNYRQHFMRHFVKIMQHNRLIVVDDGTATLDLYNARQNNTDNNEQYSFKRFKKMYVINYSV